MTEESVLSIKNFPAHVKDEARAEALRRGIDWKDFVADALREKVERLRAEDNNR